MDYFSTRLTGGKGHNDFIKWLKDEIAKMDIPVNSDPFYLRRWEGKKSSIEILAGNEKNSIPASSAYPYSGEIDENGMTEELVYVKNIADVPKIKGKIAFFNVSNINFLLSEIAFGKRSSYPEDAVLEKKY